MDETSAISTSTSAISSLGGVSEMRLGGCPLSMAGCLAILQRGVGFKDLQVTNSLSTHGRSL